MVNQKGEMEEEFGHLPLGILANKLRPEMDSDLQESVRSLLRPLPHSLFCDKLREFTPKEFVGLVADLFRQLGGDAKIGPVGANEAIDILIDGDYIVQCKKLKGKVGVPTVREVYGAAVKHRAKGVFIVAAGEFTDEAKNFGIDLRLPPVRLIDCKALFDLMNQHMPCVVADILKGIWKSQKGSED